MYPKQACYNNIMQRKNKKLIGIVVGVYVLVLVLLLGLTVAYILSKNHPVTNAELEKSFTVSEGQTVTVLDKDTAVAFTITDIHIADDDACSRDNKFDSPNSGAVEGVSMNCFTRISTELSYNGRSYRGVVLNSGTADMTFSENGAYDLIPYTIQLETENNSKTQYNATIHRLASQMVNLNQEFTLKKDELATLKNEAGTGIHLSFKVCGNNTPCLDSSTYIHNEHQFADFRTNEKPTWYKAISNSVIAKDGIQLRLLESDDATYAKFVFEKTNKP